MPLRRHLIPSQCLPPRSPTAGKRESRCYLEATPLPMDQSNSLSSLSPVCPKLVPDAQHFITGDVLALISKRGFNRQERGAGEWLGGDSQCRMVARHQASGQQCPKQRNQKQIQPGTPASMVSGVTSSLRDDFRVHNFDCAEFFELIEWLRFIIVFVQPISFVSFAGGVCSDYQGFSAYSRISGSSL